MLNANIAGFTTRAKIACAILLLLMMGGVSATKPAHAAAPPLALDGVGANTCQGQFCVQSQLLTTTKGHDVIILIVECVDGSTCDKVSSVSDSSGLTFIQRISYSTGDWLGTKLSEYYAIATSPLNSDNITVDTCTATLYCVEGMQVLAIHGANTRAIFDPNTSIPGTCSGTACGDCVAYIRATTCSVSIETSTLDFVIASTAINDAGPCGLGYPNGVVAGFTNIANNGQSFEVDYAITTTPQSNVVFSCNATDAVAIVVDAISFNGAFGISSA